MVFKYLKLILFAFQIKELWLVRIWKSYFVWKESSNLWPLRENIFLHSFRPKTFAIKKGSKTNEIWEEKCLFVAQSFKVDISGSLLLNYFFVSFYWHVAALVFIKISQLLFPFSENSPSRFFTHFCAHSWKSKTYRIGGFLI